MWSYLGQNFLKESKIKHFIANRIKTFYQQEKCTSLLEIWPGKWALTKLVIDISKNFYMIEKDLKMVQKLKEKFWLDIEKKILNEDVLELEEIIFLKEKKINPKKTIVSGNLPYYITSPILRKFFWNWKQNFAWWVFLIQREVWDKIRYDAKKKSFLWRLLNYAYDVSYLKTVPAKAFSPTPKVQSCVIWLLPKKTIEDVDFDKLFTFLDNISGFKRKTLNKISKILTKKNIMISIPEKLWKKRLEELKREDMKTILTIATT